MQFRPRADLAALGPGFFDVVAPAPFPRPVLRWRNNRAGAAIGLSHLTPAQWEAHFAHFQPFAGSLPQPLALRYHGHQFGVYNAELGDGRGFTFAQMLDADGRLLELGTKGSGQTPWSRFGDGRLTLKGGVREILAAEMLEALGVTTSRALSLFETGESLYRNDEPSPTRSSVLVRLSHGHIRIGTFQRLAALGEGDAIPALVHYVLAHLARLDPGADPYATLMMWAGDNLARMAAQWRVAGFVHGVLNTDNMNITGESFDYGPWRFLPAWDMGFTAAYFDTGGLFAFGRQAKAVHWNLLQLANALHVVAPEASLTPALEAWPAVYASHWRQQAMWRLGLERATPAEEEALLEAFEHGLQGDGGVPDAAWFHFRGGVCPDPLPEGFALFAERLAGFAAVPGARDHPYWAGKTPETLLIDEVETLWAAIAGHDDWQPFADKIAAIRRMGEAHGCSGGTQAVTPGSG